MDGRNASAARRPPRQRRLALLVLLAAVALAAAAIPFRATWWGGWILAIAEAGIVGGLADWFAVTALFRHPLGLPIPHTAIIPANWELMAERVGVMVGDRVLTKDYVRARGRALRPGRSPRARRRAPATRRSRVGGARGRSLGRGAGQPGGDQRPGRLADPAGAGEPDRAGARHRARDRAQAGLGPAADRGDGRGADRRARPPGLPHHGRRPGRRRAGRVPGPDEPVPALPHRPRQHPRAHRSRAARRRRCTTPSRRSPAIRTIPCGCA